MTPSTRTFARCPRCGIASPVIGGAPVAHPCPSVGNPARVVPDVAMAGTHVPRSTAADDRATPPRRTSAAVEREAPTPPGR